MGTLQGRRQGIVFGFDMDAVGSRCGFGQGFETFGSADVNYRWFGHAEIKSCSWVSVWPHHNPL
jgi:hypothetical protein